MHTLMMMVPVRATVRAAAYVKVSVLVTGFVGMNVRFTTRLMGVIRVRVAVIVCRNPAVAMMRPVLVASITPRQHL